MTERHKHADLIIAWANGAEIQCLYPGEALTRGWQDVKSPAWNDTHVYRIKPKRKVKKWRLIVRGKQTGFLSMTTEAYASLVEYNAYDNEWEAVELIRCSEIEVEVDD